MRSVVGGTISLLFLFSLSAFGSLGGRTDSIENDRAAMKAASIQARQGAVYSVHEIQGETGTTVREYVASDGTVFAVAWEGRFAPDLQQLLGAYFDQYTAGVKAQKAGYVGRRPLNLELPGLVVQRRGHVRAQSGRAYIPELVPPGVKVEELW